jgi:hypothetical protein
VTVVWAILIVVAADAVAITVMLLIRRRAPEGGYFSDSDRASGVFGVLATSFAIFAGFIIFLAFSSYDQSRTGAEREALTMAQQFETAQFLPVSVRDRLSGEIVCYGRSVVHQEWPQMQHGGSLPTINPWGLALFKTIKRAVPRTTAQETAYSKWFDQTTDREVGRQDRVHGATGIIPWSLWVVLILLAVVVVGYVLFYADSGERARAQAMMALSATTALVVTLLAIYVLSHPYQGIGRIKPAAMERSLQILDDARAALAHTAPLPCDASGVAL